MNNPTVLVVGAWHLGSVVGACLADAGNTVHFWDQSPRVRASWSAGKPPLHEPGLDDLVAKHWQKSVFWTETPQEIARKANWIVLSYDTPITEEDEVVLDVVDEGLFTALRDGFADDANFFLTAQLPVGTSRRFRERIAKINPKWRGNLLYQPENLRLGEAIKSFQSPDRVVIGVDDRARDEALLTQYRAWVAQPSTPVNVMSLESAEMVKHALNAFLATCVVFANEVSEVCERAGADAWDVVKSLKQDSRVGPKAFLRPGLGFAGGTLARDVKTLTHLVKKEGASNLFADLYTINGERNDWVIGSLKNALGALEGKRIMLLGVTYKPQTSTVRRSPALDIARALTRAGAKCVALDPMADLGELPPEERAQIPFELLAWPFPNRGVPPSADPPAGDPSAAFAGVDAIVLVTEWAEFKTFPWDAIRTRVVIDTKNHLALGAGHTHVIPGKPRT
ncbi:MAG TPA: nucleotide sugar dehydrogenase [Polyangiaceae bacterium]|nr:nucleotide sugar dehydrogenase [Polyangiaceae bacterium]